MRQGFIKMEYYETYYYANIINNILTDPFPYVRNIHSWYEDNEEQLFLPSFPKLNRLTQFCAFAIESLIDEEISDVTIDAVLNDNKYQVWVDRALKFHGIECHGFKSWLQEQSIALEDLTEDNLADYHNHLYLTGPLDNLIDLLSIETFHILFANRKLLATFNELLARTFSMYFQHEILAGAEDYFDRPGKLKRVSIPEWVKRAIFHRDRGMCALCSKDISGLITAQTDKHFDHIIPLSLGGLNDVTNIQLLCEKCNLEKASKPYKVSSVYESWY